MKKKITYCLIGLICLVVVVVTVVYLVKLSHSGSEDVEKIAPTKTQITIGYYDGGLGRDWIQAAKSAFESINKDVQVLIRYDKNRYSSSSMLDVFESYDEDIFMVDLAAAEFYSKNMYYDVTDAVSKPLTEYDGQNAKSILDKLNSSYKKVYLQSDNKYYAMPYYEGVYSIIYDIALFEDNKLFKSPTGKWDDGSNKSVGKDGVSGTYDDGLPTTMEEFFELCNRMITLSITPFTFINPTNGGYYSTKVLENYWASYEGYDNYLLNWTLDSNGKEYTFADKTSEIVTRNNAYKLKDGQQGKIESLQFAYNILNGYKGINGNGAYYSENVWGTTQDHLQAQTEFLLSNHTGKPIAMLMDGSWWEREAYTSFSALYKRTKDVNDQYGNRRFGIMPMPTKHDGDKGVEAVFSGVSGSQIFINKNTKHANEAIAFFRFLHSDQCMSLMTRYSNTLRPFDYQITNDDYSAMTPFTKQLVDLVKKEGATGKVVPAMCVDDCFKSSGAFFGYQRWQYGTSDVYPLMLFNNDKSLTVEKYTQNLKINKTEWDAVISAWEK